MARRENESADNHKGTDTDQDLRPDPAMRSERIIYRPNTQDET